MKLKTVTLTNFRCFRDFSLDLDEQLTVLVARNGAGKTALLDGIAIGLGAFISRLKVSSRNTQFDRDRHDLFIDENDKQAAYAIVSIISNIDVEWDRIQYRGKSKSARQKARQEARQNRLENSLPRLKETKEINNYVEQYLEAFDQDDPFELPVFAYYGTKRAVFQVLKRLRDPQEDFPRFDAFHQALNANTNFRRLFEYLTYLDHLRLSEIEEREDFEYKLPQLETIWKAVGSMVKGVSNPEIKLSPPRFLVDWHDGDETKTLQIEQLSDGYRTTLAMVMDLASRMAQANPDMEDPLQTTGVVLIDEVDLHLHPGWQQEILPDLLRTFPNIQFIVTTHSPQVLTTVPHESIRVIDWKNDEPVVKSVGFSEGAEAQQLLNDVLEVDSRPDTPLVRKFHNYFELVNAGKGETDKALKIRAELDRVWGGNEPKLAKADMRIRLRSQRNNHHEKSE